MSGGFRAQSSIPNNVKKMIQNIKEITGNHSDDEIYAMLKDCSMDPNETAQKLLLQDTFHEVKRRRDRKKETQPNRETGDLRWKSGAPGRGGRGGRGNYTSRYAAQDAGVGRNTASRKENGFNQASDRSRSISSPAVGQEAKSKDAGSSVTIMANGSVGVVSGAVKSAHPSEVPLGRGIEQPEMSSQRQLHGATKGSNISSGGRDGHGKSMAPVTSSDICSSVSDPVLVPSDDSRSSVGAIKREVGSQCSPVEPNSNISTEPKSNASKVKSHVVGKSQAAELSQSSLSHGGSSSSRPSSNYGNRSQQAMGSQKLGPNKEWKPKPTNTNTVQAPKTLAGSDGSEISAATGVRTQNVQSTTNSEEATNKLQNELENLHVRDTQPVIIPNHIHVPEAVRTGLSFGSFDAAFVITPNRPCKPDDQKSSTPIAETHQETKSTAEEEAASQGSLAPADDADYNGPSLSPKQVPVNVSSNDVSGASSSVPDISDSKKETAIGPQHSNAHTAASYNFGLIPPVLGNPLGPLEGSETQARDVTRVPSFMVQPPVDPSSFYAQFYRSGADSDGRISPFPAPGVAAKYNGNVAVLSSQSSQSPPEGGNSLVMSTAAQTPLAQAAGVMQNSMAVTQQTPLFQQPPGVHLPHYPPNYIPYGHYFSPFYVPPPAMHHFLGNNAFPQQAQPGSVYPGPPGAAAATAVKFPLSQYKPGSNIGNSAHMSVGGSYGPYGAAPAGYSPGSAVTAGNSTVNEDLAASQFKEANMYIAGQQSEGSAVWIPAPGREISNLPANSFYNLPPQGQHVTFAPTQAGQGTFAGLYHPAQAVTAGTVHPLLQQSQAMPGGVDMVGANASVYQQSQHAQMNWPNNY